MKSPTTSRRTPATRRSKSVISWESPGTRYSGPASASRRTELLEYHRLRRAGRKRRSQSGKCRVAYQNPLTGVILSAAKDLLWPFLHAREKQVLRCAQDDKAST